MPLKEAMQMLKAHNPKLQMKQETIKYDVLGGELLFGLTFTSPEERFIIGLTMPPIPLLSRNSPALSTSPMRRRRPGRRSSIV